MSRFSITNGKGFNLTFANEWTISVQWGPGNYCEREGEDWNAPDKTSFWTSQGVVSRYARMVGT